MPFLIGTPVSTCRALTLLEGLAVLLGRQLRELRTREVSAVRGRFPAERWVQFIASSQHNFDSLTDLFFLFVLRLVALSAEVTTFAARGALTAEVTPGVEWIALAAEVTLPLRRLHIYS